MPCASSARCVASQSRTVSISRLCDEPLGAVKLALGPSYCTAVPRTGTSAETPESSKKASQPSPRQYPSPRRSNVWQRPKAESIPAAEKAIDTACVNMPTPVAAAYGHSASLIADAAECKATSDDEHAVSSVRHGPVSPSVKETRPDATESAPEVPEYTEGAFVVLLPASASAPSLDKEPPAPRMKPTGVFTSHARRLDAQSVAVVVSRTTII